MAGDSESTDDIVRHLNGDAIARSAVVARRAATVLIVVGAIGVLAWIWETYRSQDRLSDITISTGFNPLDDGGRDVELPDRLDFLVQNLNLLILAALALGLGALVRLLADHIQAAAGGDVTGYRRDAYLDEEAFAEHEEDEQAPT